MASAICDVASSSRTRAAPFAPDGWPAWFLSVDDEVWPRAVERGEEPEEQARRERQADSEQDDRAARC